MSELVISDLFATAKGEPIIKGLSLRVASGEVHAVMGPNGSGKSTLAHVLAGRPGYEATSGKVEMDGTSITELSPYERASLGLFLAQQYPIEIPGVRLADMLEAASMPGIQSNMKQKDLSRLVSMEAKEVGLTQELMDREGINVDLSGGERKRSEALQMAVLKPRIAILDELDSGLDLDAIEGIGQRVYKMVQEDNLGVLAITHYARFLDELPAQYVHILFDGKIVESGGPELAFELEDTGYARFEGTQDTSVDIRLG